MPSTEFNNRAQRVQTPRLFHALTGWTTRDILRIATGGLPDVTSRRISYMFPRFHEDGLMFRLDITGPGYADSYTIAPLQRYTMNGNTNNTRGDRTGRLLHARQLIVGQVLGYREMNFSAGDMVGAYVWAKAGVPVAGTRTELTTHLRNRARLISNQIDDRTAKGLAALIRLRQPRDLYDLARLPDRLNIDDALFARAFDTCDLPRRYGLQDYRDKGFAAGNMTLGQFMLCGLEYAAQLRYADGPTMNLVEAYSGIPTRRIAAAILRRRKAMPTLPKP